MEDSGILSVNSQTQPTEILPLSDIGKDQHTKSKSWGNSSRANTDQDEYNIDNMIHEDTIEYRDDMPSTPVDVSTALMYASENNPDRFPDGGLQANLVLLGSFIGLIADFGIANAMGAIESYVSTHQLLNDKQTNVSWVFSLHLGVMYFGGVFFGELFDKFGAKRPLIVGTICMTTGLILTAESHTLYQFILSFSLLTAIGTSICMSPLIGVLSHWFLKKRARACSIATIGGLVGASCFAIMLQQLYDKIGYKWAVRVLALICLTCMSISILLVKERTHTKIEKSQDDGSIQQVEEDVIPETEVDIEVEVDGTTKPKSEPTSKSKHHLTEGNILKAAISFLRGALDFSMLKDQRFVLLTIAVFLAEIISMTTLTYLSSYALNFGLSNSKSYLLITIVNVCGIPSRLVSGILADKYGRFNVMIGTSVLTTIVVFAVWLPARGSVGMLFAFGALFGVSTSAVISLIPACTGQICSAENFGKVYGTLYFFLAFLTILGMYFASLVISDRSLTDYRNFVLYEGALAVASVISWLWARYTAVGWRLVKF
ncbi:major facilitator superfamily domain-containing protein [Scheffersomyces amazonensis]|uniref:major facilitator superfamily domain-containing protein n=1 Tax=Scheffersomyces amazonensis TaxID=1078765 RepID=UPI00315D0CDF